MLPQPAFISVRTDGRPGSGTEADPFNGSTPDRLDPLMRGFPEGSFIRFLEGEFLTTGSYSHNEDRGWYVKDDWRVFGTGDRTTVKLLFPKGADGNGHGVFEMSQYSAGGVEIADLTIDEGWPHNGIGPVNATFAVGLYGDNNTIRRVRAISGYGHLASLQESFSLSIRSRYAGGWQDNVNALIEDCTVELYRGDYGIAIGLYGGADGFTGSVSGAIRRNTVNGFVGTAAFGLGNRVIHENNRTLRCRRAVYMDTGKSENVTIKSCRFMDTSWPAIHLDVSMGAASVRNLQLIENTIETNGLLGPACGIALSAHKDPLSDIAILRNTFKRKAIGPHTQIDAIVAARVDGLLVEGNTVDPQMRSLLRWPEYPSRFLTVKHNRTPDGAVPEGLEDYYSYISAESHALMSKITYRAEDMASRLERLNALTQLMKGV